MSSAEKQNSREDLVDASAQFTFIEDDSYVESSVSVPQTTSSGANKH